MSGPPLAGLRVVVTRARHQAAGLAAELEAAGAEAVLLPLIEVVEPEATRPLVEAAAGVGEFDWLVFTSANAVTAFLPRLAGPLPARLRIAVVGPATAKAVRTHGEDPDLEAAKSDAEGLATEMGSRLQGHERVLVPRADDARPALVDGLRTLGYDVTAVDAYRKRLPPEAVGEAHALFDDHELGWVTFTSPRIVRHFARLFGVDWKARRGELAAASIGSVTTRELRRQGVERIVEAKKPSSDEMVRALVAALDEQPG